MATSLIITSPGIAPSNRKAGFPNLARETPASPEVIEDVSDICEAELRAAGIAPYRFGFLLSEQSEVPSKVVGQFGMWGFKRAWYYWAAEGPGLPVEIAEKLHASHGSQVRVAGHCGCPSPREWFKGFGVDSYHIDGPDGLRALVDALRSVYDPANDPTTIPQAQGGVDA